MVYRYTGMIFPLYTLIFLSSFENGIQKILGEQEFVLPSYDIGSPSCIANITSAHTTVTCNYDATVPSVLGIDGIESELFGWSGCSGTVPDGIAIDTSTLEGPGDNSNYQVVLDIDPVATAPTGDIAKFCLRTKVLDNNDNEMKYNGQVLSLSFNYTSDFQLATSIGQFEGINEIATDLGTKQFKVEAHRCTKEKERDNSDSSLDVDGELYVCIESLVDGIVIDEVIDFVAEKRSGTTIVRSHRSINRGLEDFNTVKNGLGTKTAQVGTKPPLFFFEDSLDMTVRGSVILATDTGRYLARFTQAVNDRGTEPASFELQIKIIEISSTVTSPVTTKNSHFTENNAVLGLIGVVVVLFSFLMVGFSGFLLSKSSTVKVPVTFDTGTFSQNKIS